MPKPEKVPDPDHAANRRLMWGIYLAALAWGLMIGLGALLHDTTRGLIVFGVVLALTGIWALLLLRWERKRNSREKF